MAALDPYKKPPEDLRKIFKRYQKMSIDDFDGDASILDFDRPATELVKYKLQTIRNVNTSDLHFQSSTYTSTHLPTDSTVNVYESAILPGWLLKFTSKSSLV